MIIILGFDVFVGFLIQRRIKLWHVLFVTGKFNSMINFQQIIGQTSHYECPRGANTGGVHTFYFLNFCKRNDEDRNSHLSRSFGSWNVWFLKFIRIFYFNTIRTHLEIEWLFQHTGWHIYLLRKGQKLYAFIDFRFKIVRFFLHGALIVLFL